MRIKLPWVPEDIFLLSILMVRGEAASTRPEVASDADVLRGSSRVPAPRRNA